MKKKWTVDELLDIIEEVDNVAAGRLLPFPEQEKAKHFKNMLKIIAEKTKPVIDSFE